MRPTRRPERRQMAEPATRGHSLGTEEAGRVEDAAAWGIREVARSALPLHATGQVSARNRFAERAVDVKDVGKPRWLIVAVHRRLLRGERVLER